MANFATYSSPLGYIRIEHRHERLTQLKILSGAPEQHGVRDRFTDMVFSQVEAYLNAERRSFDVDIDLSGCTPFQRAVLEELLNIPYGERRSYKQIAVAIGNPKASRAVGLANRNNPIHIIIPCHRVVGSNGKLTGYAAGLAAKEFLLDCEAL